MEGGPPEAAASADGTVDCDGDFFMNGAGLGGASGCNRERMNNSVYMSVGELNFEFSLQSCPFFSSFWRDLVV